MTSFWCEQALIGNPEAGRIATGVVVEEVHGRITHIEERTLAPTGATRLSGLVLPGLSNAHSHAFHRVLRGATERARGDFWSWRDAMFEVAQVLEPDTYEPLCSAVFAEMALSGITTVGEFHYVHHAPGGTAYADPNAMTSAVIAGAQRAGIRLSVIDTCYLTGGIGEPLAGAQARFGDVTAEGWRERVERFVTDETSRLCAGVHSVRALSPKDIEFVASFARTNSLPLHFHLSEQKKENEQSLAAYGRTPTRLLSDCGALGPSSVAVHATFAGESDVALLGSSKTAVCLCPSTEQDLADGIGPAEALARCGSPLVLGSDSNALVDLFAEARGVELDGRLASGRRAILEPEALLASATTTGARALGWPDAGEISVGSFCDLLALDTRSSRLAGAVEVDPVAAVVFCANASDVTDVVVGGRTVVKERRHVAFDDLARSLSAAIGALRNAA
ncbi:MAG: formimidoylglutamate deiminase [Acidimicrobiales bacterium]